MYPVAVEADHIEPQSRLKTFFRFILLIPIAIVSIFWGLGACFALIAAWVMLVITGRYPEGLYGFVSGVIRFSTRLNGYAVLMTDRYPSFGIDEQEDYPVRVRVGPRPERQSRVKAFFRMILAIPAYIGAYIANLVIQVIAIANWFVIVFTGKLPKGLFDVTGACLAYQTRFYGYAAMLTDEYPPLFTFDPPTSGSAALAGAPAPASSLADSPESLSTPAPSVPSPPPAAPEGWEPPTPG